jgi:histidinol-phosphate phosphatase family protein
MDQKTNEKIHPKKPSSKKLLKAIFLDRDDTIIVDKAYLNDPDKIEYLPKAIEGLLDFQRMGFILIIVTNQSGIPRGLVTLENLELIHRKMSRQLRDSGVEITDFYFAPHMPDSQHPWRKPNPGMILQAAEDHSLDLSQSWMIGDGKADVEAGNRAGCRTVMVKKGTSEKKDEPLSQLETPTLTAANLQEAAQKILALNGLKT